MNIDCYFKTPLGRKKLKVEMWLDPDSEYEDDCIYCLKFPYFKPMVEFVKTLDRPSTNSFDPKTKIWRIKYNRRNIFCLNMVTTNDMVQKFIRPLSEDVFDGNWIHQNEMENAIRTRKTCLIAGEMRTGKTKPTLNCIRDLAKGQAWIVSGKNALVSFLREIKKWNVTKNIYTRYFTYSGFRIHVQNLIASSKSDKYLNLETTTCITKENIPNFIVFDEMQHLKTPGTQVTTAANQVSQWMFDLYGWDNYYMVGLSGTPQPKNPGDWWSLIEILCPGFIKESNRAQFERRLSEQELRINDIGQEYWHFLNWKKEEIDKLYRRLKPIVFVYLKKYVLDLPPLEYEVVDILPSKEILRTARLITKNEIHTLSAINKLRQLSDGFMYQHKYDEKTNEKRKAGLEFVGSPKIQQLTDDLDCYAEAADKGCGRILIYAGFQGSLDIITNTCLDKDWVVLRIDARGQEVFTPTIKGQPYHTTLGLNKSVDVDLCLQEMDRSTATWLIPKLAIVANPEAGGEGAEYSATPVIIYYSNTNKGGARMQSEARPHSNNMDKARGLLIKDYCHLPSDYTILEKLKQKKDLQAISLGELNTILNKEPKSKYNFFLE